MLRTLTTLALFAAATTAFAHPVHDGGIDRAGIDARQHRQQQRIADGYARGNLTPREARLLEREQAFIRAKERAYGADGVLTRAERADLQRDLDRASRNIARERHDRDHRG